MTEITIESFGEFSDRVEEFGGEYTLDCGEATVGELDCSEMTISWPTTPTCGEAIAGTLDCSEATVGELDCSEMTISGGAATAPPLAED